MTELAEALPEVQSKGEQHVAYSVRGKNFAYFLDDHHGDGKIAIACKAAPGAQAELIEREGERFYAPAYLGSRGWVALDLEAGKVDWTEVRTMLADAYRLLAPKKLSAQLAGQ
ncbi:MmcQ/YjbR family DNA-binding protein [Amycolatopsis rubida]|uniref:MmcQ/YjbR family DNA-binding protein n=1 Tax=Amycolatopsis rubida TaxID=112413 RepID=A0ABX0C3H2_9PSEU|nr:MmcQ/YjbR family DNA-binding protein [Amycolatopsis sp. M39]MYW97340.1 MmcQ/YjbR family DNA-binding protein [Amycolatopsis rubida]NEC62325.1 MmcQ/YjbR family DNA-binding protein [Amycolatopsis rubida]